MQKATRATSGPAQGDWVGLCLRAYRSGRPLAVMLDYEGTLVPPDQPAPGRPGEPARHLLAALRGLPGVAVGVFGWRPLAELRETVGVPGLFYAGSGGAEMGLGGERLACPTPHGLHEAINSLWMGLVRVASTYPGTWVERKAFTCSLHYHALAPLRALAFRREVLSLVGAWPAVRCQAVSQSLVLSPADGWHKGTAVAALLSRLDDDALPIYAGDAGDDAEAMAVVSCLGGLAVGVGPGAPPLATHRAGSPGELAEGLGRLLAELPAARPPSSSPPPRSPAAAQDWVATSGEPAGEAGSTKPGVLVVDSDPKSRSETARGMRAEGWQVWEAGGGEEALALLRRLNGSVKAAIVDLQMPGIQGWRALRELGEAAPSLARCATTAGVSAQAAEAFRRTSATPLFVRPFPIEAVSAELHRLLGEEVPNQGPVHFAFMG